MASGAYVIHDNLRKLAETRPGDPEREQINNDVRSELQRRAKDVQAMPNGEAKLNAVKHLRKLFSMYTSGLKGQLEKEYEESEEQK